MLVFNSLGRPALPIHYLPVSHFPHPCFLYLIHTNLWALLFSRKVWKKWLLILGKLMENERSFSVFLLLPFLDLIVTWSAKNFLCDKKHAKIKAPLFSSFTPLIYWAWPANYETIVKILWWFRQTTLFFLNEKFRPNVWFKKTMTTLTL